MTRFKVQQWLVLSLSVAFGGLLLTGCSKEEAPVVEEVAQIVKVVTVGDATGQSRVFTGQVRANKRVELAFQVSGPLSQLSAEEGQQVKKGALLAQILPRDFETALAAARANAVEAEQQYLRYKELYVRKQASKAQFDKVKSQHDIAQSNLKKSQDVLADTSLRAPFSGVVAKRFVENYTEVRAKDPIVSLQDISKVEVLISVPERMAADVKNDQKKQQVVAEFVTAPGKQFPLKLKEFATQADPQTQTYQVTMVMDQPSSVNILPGMTATVRTLAPEKGAADATLVLPTIAVVGTPESGSYVWVVDPQTNQVAKREVQTGNFIGNDRIEALQGVQTGETVAVSGVTQLREGMEIRPVAEVLY